MRQPSLPFWAKREKLSMVNDGKHDNELTNEQTTEDTSFPHGQKAASHHRRGCPRKYEIRVAGFHIKYTFIMTANIHLLASFIVYLALGGSEWPGEHTNTQRESRTCLQKAKLLSFDLHPEVEKPRDYHSRISKLKPLHNPSFKQWIHERPL